VTVLLGLPQYRRMRADLRQHVSTEWRTSPLPNSFNFPDRWFNGKEHVNKPTFIAPKSTLGGAIYLLSVPTLQQVQQGQRHIYYWGWAGYTDVFSPKKHITEFCAELKSNGTNFDPTKGFPFRLDACAEHNCMDGECKIKHGQ
jgi:hypothetical protein